MIEGLNVGNGKIMSLLTSTEMCDTDREIIVVLLTWLENWDEEKDEEKKQALLEYIMPSPTLFVLNYLDNPCFERENKYESFYRVLTYNNLHKLILKIRECLLTSGSIFCCCKKKRQIRNKRKYKYGHDLLASILSGDTGFQTSLSNCTFYRYNKIIYIMTDVLHVWDKEIIGYSLLPCNDKVFDNAYGKRIVKKKMKATLANAIELTKIAKRMHGDDFYKLYKELL